jgi:VWFA-related protein
MGRTSLPVILMIAAFVASRGLSAQQPLRFGERVDVTRVIIDARVLDDRGDPVLGLTEDDFKVNIDGMVGRVETATWVGGGATNLNAGVVESAPPAGAGAERLIIFLFQKDLEPSRIVGLMRMLLKSRDFLSTLAPNDRVAVLSFDTHLKIWTDFTSDRSRLEHLLARGLLFDQPPAVQRSSIPSLLDRLDPDRGRKTYGMERALELIGEALEPLPGSKSLVLIGYGFGRFSSDGVTMENSYGAARRALVVSRTSVFSLDVTTADYHSLEKGLQLVSEETGGFYARTHIFPDLAMRRLSGALAGYYVLFVEKPDSRRTTHDIEVELTRRQGRVLATSSYTERN